LRTEFTQKTNDAIGAITDGGKNLILSSAFQTDPAMKNWQSVNNKVVVKEKNSQNWAYMSQSGLSTDNPIGLTSNYFAMKANDPLVIAFDIIIGDVSKLDNKTVLNVSYYDKDDNRVDFKDYTLADLGIKSPANGATNRAYIKVNTTHDDVVKGAILPRLSRNGEVWMSNFFAKISSISNGDYEVANADLEDMQSTDHFKLEQTAQGLTAKADSSQLNKLSGDLTTLSNNFSTTSSGFQASLSKIDDKVDTNKTNTDKSIADTNAALQVAKADIKATADNLSTNYTKTTDEHNYVNSQIKESADKINLSVASVSDKVDGMEIGGRNLIQNSGDPQDTSDWGKVPGGWYMGTDNSGSFSITKHQFYYNGNRRMFQLNNKTANEVYVGSNFVNIKPETEYTLSMDEFNDGNLTSFDVYYIGSDTNENVQIAIGKVGSPSRNQRFSYTFKTKKSSKGFIRIDNNGSKQVGTTCAVFFGDVTLTEGKNPAPWTPAPEDTDSKIAALQIVDDQIKSTVSNKADTSYVDQKAGEISSTVGKQIDGIQVGGRNLLLNSSGNVYTINAIPDSYVQHNLWRLSDQIADYEGDLTLTLWGTPSKTSENYKQQMKFKIGNAWGNDWNTIKGNDVNWNDSNPDVYKINDSLYKVIFHFELSKKYQPYLPQLTVFTSHTNIGWTFSKAKLEIGNKSTDLSPAPEDMATVTALSKVDQKADSISQTVASKADASQITQLSNQINLKVSQADFDNLQIGGRNLLIGTSDTWDSGTNSGWGNFSSKTVNITEPGMYTANVYLKPDKKPVKIAINITNSDGTYHNYFGNIVYGGSEGYSTLTVQVTEGQTLTSIWIPFDTPQNDVTSVSWKRMKLEKGNKATDWSPAPEDTISQINIDKSGVLISGNKVHITGDTTIDNASIDGAKIKNLSADKITSGSINTDSVKIYNKKYNIEMELDGALNVIGTTNEGTWINSIGQSGMIINQTNNAGKFEMMGEYGVMRDTNDLNGLSVTVTPISLGNGYGGDYFSVGKATSISSTTMGIHVGWRYVANQRTELGEEGIHTYDNSYMENGSKLVFKGTSGNNGVWIDSYGNVQGNSNSSVYRVNDKNGGNTFAVETNGSGKVWFGTQFSDGGGSLYSGDNNGWYMRNHDGSYGNVNAKAFIQKSSIDLKKNIEMADTDNLANDVYNMDVTTWNYKEETSQNSKHIGAVIGGDYHINSCLLSDDKTGVNTTSLTFALVATAQKQAKQISELTAELTVLKIKGEK
jgi:gp58-like protein.